VSFCVVRISKKKTRIEKKLETQKKKKKKEKEFHKNEHCLQQPNFKSQ